MVFTTTGRRREICETRFAQGKSDGDSARSRGLRPGGEMSLGLSEDLGFYVPDKLLGMMVTKRKAEVDILLNHAFGE